MDATRSEKKTLLEMVAEEQARHAAQAAWRGRVARERFIGAAFWFGISWIMPSELKWVAWVVAFVMLFAALWHAEQRFIERRLSRLSPWDV